MKNGLLTCLLILAVSSTIATMPSVGHAATVSWINSTPKLESDQNTIDEQVSVNLTDSGSQLHEVDYHCNLEHSSLNQIYYVDGLSINGPTSPPYTVRLYGFSNSKEGNPKGTYDCYAEAYGYTSSGGGSSFDVVSSTQQVTVTVNP